MFHLFTCFWPLVLTGNVSSTVHKMTDVSQMDPPRSMLHSSDSTLPLSDIKSSLRFQIACPEIRIGTAALKLCRINDTVPKAPVRRKMAIGCWCCWCWFKVTDVVFCKVNRPEILDCRSLFYNECKSMRKWNSPTSVNGFLLPNAFLCAEWRRYITTFAHQHFLRGFDNSISRTVLTGRISDC